MRPRVVAVDWSGARAPKTLRLAEASGGRLRRLERFDSREGVVEELIRCRKESSDRPLVAGLDFAFSMPAGFIRSLQVPDADALWARVFREGEDWLRGCRPPFWGKPGCRRPAAGFAPFRATELETPAVAGIRPKSVFQIGGAGAVGVGSLRGMPHLLRLRAAGFSVWPFHGAALHRVIEIYPRLLEGAVRKSDATHRAAYLEAHWPGIAEPLRSRVVASEDAFDAAVSALVMDRHADRLLRLPAARSKTDLLEGRIWNPADTPPMARTPPSSSEAP